MSQHRPASEGLSPIPTTTTVAALPHPARAGAWVHLMVIVRGTAADVPAGTVTIRDGAHVLGAVELRGGRAVLKVQLFSAGEHEMYASYEGNELAAPSGGGCSVVVLEQPQVIIAATPDALRAAALTLQAQVHGRWDSPRCTGTVLFECDGEPVGDSEVHGGSATLMYSPPPGLHTITAVYVGDDRYCGVRSAPLTIDA